LPSISSRHARCVVVVIFTPLIDYVFVTLSLLRFEHVLSVEKCEWGGGWAFRLKLVKPRLINDLRLTVHLRHILTIAGTVLVLAFKRICDGRILHWPNYCVIR